MNAKQWNLMIRMVNDGNAKTEVQRYFSKEDMKIYSNMCKELMEIRKKDPKAMLSPVESDW